MADVVTHVCSAFLVKAATGRRNTPAFVAGVVLPDLLSRVPSMGLAWLQRTGVGVPDAWVYGWTPLHLPAGILLWSAAVASLAAALRKTSARAIFWNLLGGGLLHLAVDLFQAHYTGGYALGFPWIDYVFEFGFIGSEATVWAAIPLALLTAWIWRRGRH